MTETESKVVGKEFRAKFDALQATYKKHKEFANRFFRRSPSTLIQLGLEGRYPTKYDEIFTIIKLFYTTIANNATIQAEFSKIKITPEVVTECLSQFDNVLALRADFAKEKGESQDATKAKDAAITTMDEWKEDFDDLATIALYDKPQLLEVLGIFVRS